MKRDPRSVAVMMAVLTILLAASVHAKCYTNAYKSGQAYAKVRVCGDNMDWDIRGNPYFKVWCDLGGKLYVDTPGNACNSGGCYGSPSPRDPLNYYVKKDDKTLHFTCWKKVEQGGDWAWSSVGIKYSNVNYEKKDIVRYCVYGDVANKCYDKYVPVSNAQVQWGSVLGSANNRGSYQLCQMGVRMGEIKVSAPGFGTYADHANVNAGWSLRKDIKILPVDGCSEQAPEEEAGEPDPPPDIEIFETWMERFWNWILNLFKLFDQPASIAATPGLSNGGGSE